MTNTIRIAVIGAGMAGQAHAFGYRNATMAQDGLPAVELAVIADPNLELAQRVAQRYGFTEATADIDAVLADPTIDAVSVALPNFAHADVLPKIIASGKHLFAEKPIGRTRDEADQMAELASATTAVTGVGFSFRRLPGLAAVQQAVAEGLIGDVHTARAWYYADYAADPRGELSWRYSQEESGGGALLDIGAHAIDALAFVAGPVAAVENATLSTVYTQRPLPSAGAIGHGASASTETGPVTNDDVAMLTVRLASGALGQVSLSRIAAGTPNSLGVELYGTQGHIRFDSMSAGEFHLFRTGGDERFSGAQRVITGPAHPYFSDVAAMPGGGVGTGYAEAFVAEIQEFVRAIATGSTMDTDFGTAAAMMRVVDAAFRSSAEQRAVAIDAPAFA